MRFVGSFVTSRRGATALEYALIAGLISVIVIAGVTLVGQDTGNNFNNIANKL